MIKKVWKNRIKSACEEAGTYKPCFDDVIDTLAGILEKRDDAEKILGKEPVIIEHTNKGGAVNLEQHPAVRLINDLNRDALTYWRDLGLTPKGLKAIKDDAMKEKNTDEFIEALDRIGV